VPAGTAALRHLLPRAHPCLDATPREIHSPSPLSPTTSTCRAASAIEAPWLVNGGHGASLRQHKVPLPHHIHTDSCGVGPNGSARGAQEQLLSFQAQGVVCEYDNAMVASCSEV
jgi:hypothetical protein